MRNLDEQRYLWVLRILLMLFVISVISNLILFIAFTGISPVPKSEVFFVSADNNKITDIFVKRGVSNRYSISQDSLGFEISKQYIIDYIIERESLFTDKILMNKKYNENSMIYNFSVSKVYNEFTGSKEYLENSQNEKGLVKTVVIKNVEYQPKSQNWIIITEIKTTDSFGLNPIYQNKKIKITAGFVNAVEKISLHNKGINPLGFKIISYEYFD